MPDTTPTTDLADRLRATLTERFTSLGNPFSEMRYNERGPDGWPASHPVSPDMVATVLRELLADASTRQVLGTTDQQPETAPAGTELRDRIAQALYQHSHPGWALRYTDLDQDQQDTYQGRANAILAVLPAPTDQATEFELRADTEIRAAALREAADEAQRIATAMATADEDWASRAGWACASVATGLRRMADEAQQPEADGCKRCGCSPRCCACDFDEAQQPATVLPSETHWRVETRWHTGEWRSTGRAWDTDHDWVKEGYNHNITLRGKSHAYRLLRATTTYVTEAEHQPNDEAQQPETEAHEHTWVTALDGDDEPARDETGRTWTHCGICGQPPATEDQPR